MSVLSPLQLLISFYFLSNTIFKKGIGYEIKLYLVLVLLTLNCDPVTQFVGCFLSSYNSTLVGIRQKLPIGKDQLQGQ